MTTRLTTNEIVELTGLSPQVLQAAVDVGLVRPITNGKGGRGRQREYSVPEAVGLTLGGVMRDAGWHPSAVKEVISYVANMSERELRRQVDSGETILLQPPLRDGGEALWIDPSVIVNRSREARLYCATHDVGKILGQVLAAAGVSNPRQNGRDPE